MFGNHVIPILVFHFGSGSWFDPYDCHCCGGALHLPDRLVNHAQCSSGDRVDVYREFCYRHPEIRDVCDLGQMLYYGWRWVWYGTATMFLLNNTFVQVRALPHIALLEILRKTGASRSDRGRVSEHHDRRCSLHNRVLCRHGSSFFRLLPSPDVPHPFEIGHACCNLHLHFGDPCCHLRGDNGSPQWLQYRRSRWYNGR